MIKKIILIFSLISLSGFTSLPENEKTDLSNKVNQFYNQKQYDKAIDIYQKLVDSGLENPKLYYNLADCYYKVGEKSKSKLYFIKAKNLAPRDSKIDDKIPPEYETDTSIFSNIFIWNKFINTSESLNITMGLWLLLCIVIIGNNFIKSNKENYKLILNTLIVLNIIFISSTTVKTINSFNKIGVISSEKAEVKSSNDSSGINLFDLKEGSIVNILKIEGDYAQINYDDKKGWVRLTSILL
jgi:tetratricopeptide (TPR) repeat protein